MTIADALFDADASIHDYLEEDKKKGGSFYAAPEDLPEIERVLAEMKALRLKLDGYPPARSAEEAALFARRSA